MSYQYWMSVHGDSHICGDMKCQELLFVLWFFSIFKVNQCAQVDSFVCLTDYWHEIECVLSITGSPVGYMNYTLAFTESDCKTATCRLKPHNNRYSCAVKIKPLCFSTEADFSIRLSNELSEPLQTLSFTPSQNIQTKPPHTPIVQQTSKGYNVTWKSGYEGHEFFDAELDFQLLLCTSEGDNPRILKVDKSFTLVEGAQLVPDTTHCIKVKSKPLSPDYESIWSKWSSQTCWKTEARKEQTNILIIICKSLGPVVVVGGVLLLVLCSPTVRLKTKTLAYTPSPAPFFQPLFQQHDGNLKEWISSQGKYVVKQMTDEILIAEVVDVVPKPITKKPDDEQDLWGPLVTPLVFTQCRNSYVGLPGTHGTPATLPIICPSNTSYTQLPCAIWGFGEGEGDDIVDNLSPKDFLNSSADSGCGCEDSTNSPECSAPSSPDNALPPPCDVDDYYTLKQTENGVVPVVVSKKNYPPEYLQES